MRTSVEHRGTTEGERTGGDSVPIDFEEIGQPARDVEARREGDPQTVTIRDADGEALTSACIRLDGGSRLIVLAEVQEPDALMGYFFLRGASLVSVSVGESMAEGRLDTRWQGGSRTWMVKLSAPLTARGSAEDELRQPTGEQAARAAIC